MTAPKPDVCRVMAESLWCWAAVPTKYHVEDDEDKSKEEWLTEMTDAIRNHTIVPEMVEFISGKKNSYGFDRLDRVKAQEILAKAAMSGDKPQANISFECPPVCDHVWDGEVWKSKDGRVESATCSKCGVRSIDVDLMRLP